MPKATTTKVKKPLIKNGDRVYVRKGAEYVPATADQDQPSAQAKKIFVVLDCDLGKEYNRDWVYINQLMTPEDYEVMAQAKIENIKAVPAIAAVSEIEVSPDIEFEPAPELAPDGSEIELSAVVEFEPAPAEEAPAEEAPTPAPAEEAPAPQKKRGVIKKTGKLYVLKGDRLYLREADDRYTEVICLQSQMHSGWRKVFVQKGDEKFEAVIKDLLTPEEFEAVKNGTSDTYPDGIRRDSNIGKLRAEDEAKQAAMYKDGDRVYWRIHGDKRYFAIVQKDQTSVNSKKVKILYWKPQGTEGMGPIWANISDLTKEENAAWADVSARAKQTFKDGEWLYLETKKTIVVVQCSCTQLAPADLVWVTEYKKFYQDRYTARPENLTRMTNADNIAEAEAFKKLTEDKIEEARLKDALIAKAERDQAEKNWLSDDDSDSDDDSSVAESNYTGEGSDSTSPTFTDPKSFVEVLKLMETPAAIKELCDRLLALPRFNLANISAKTKMQKLSPYNVAVKKSGIELKENVNAIMTTKADGSLWLRHLYFKFVGVIDHDWDAQRKIAGDKVIAKLDHQITVDAIQYIETIKNCLVSDDVYTVLAGLVAASGRRPIEIFYKGEFTNLTHVFNNKQSAPVKPNISLFFTGQVKKRDDEVAGYEIFILGCDPDYWVKKLNQTRQNPAIKDRVEALDLNDPDYLKKLSDPIRIQVNRAIAKKFCWLPARMDENSQTCKTLRSVWAAVANEMYGDPATNKLLGASRLLGHFEGSPASLVTTLGYSDISVVNAVKSVASPAQVPDTETKSEPVLLVQNAQEGAIDGSNDESIEQSLLTPSDAQIEANTEEKPAQQSLQVIESYLQPSYIDTVEESEGRHALDFYETPPWLTLLALKYTPISGTVAEPCAGYGAIEKVFKMAGFEVWTNDIDPEKKADRHGDASDPVYWQTWPGADWVVSNPPYKDLSAPIVINAYEKARQGIAMVLRLNWFEGCDDRADFLKKHPPTKIINVPRYCYRKGTATNKWATDQCPTNIYIWEKANKSKLTEIITLSAEEIPLFHRTPDSLPTVAQVDIEVRRIMEEKGTVTQLHDVIPDLENIESIEAPERLMKITRKMIPFLKVNAGKPDADRWYVGQNIVKAVSGCKTTTTVNEWVRHYGDYLKLHNQKLKNISHNRGRVFTYPD